jgi:NADH dehydrogenase/NADH:ubiquinone oxidoreductase subunit G
VEVNKKGWDDDWWKLTTSCNYPVLEGLSVRSESEKILKHRRLVIELILARAPASKRVQAMAEKLGVDGGRLRETSDELCILCGLCSRVCDEVIGAHALTFFGRGGKKEMGTPYLEASDLCIGCGACEAVCPTGAVQMLDIDLTRKLTRWGTEHEFVKCRICGKPVGPARQIERLREQMLLEKEIFETCTECKRDRYARSVVAEGHL